MFKVAGLKRVQKAAVFKVCLKIKSDLMSRIDVSRLFHSAIP